MRLIAITGGIGSGKSVVSTLLRIMGYYVYDCDIQAKQLMESDPIIVAGLKEKFGKGIYTEAGHLQRNELAAQIFSDSEALNYVNRLVHAGVKDDMQKEMLQERKDGLFFVETAIPFSSGINEIADYMWQVCASEETRIKRVMVRNNCAKEAVLERMHAQKKEMQVTDNTILINNDETSSVIEQVTNAIKQVINRD